MSVLLKLLSLGRFDEKCTLTHTVTEVVELGTTYFTTASDFNLGNTWCMKWEDTLDALTGGNFTHGVGCIDTAAFFADAKTSKDLNL